MRILLFTGKGGVGKTTVAAATALHAAARGVRTVVLSTDPAHSLADAFGVALGDEPVQIAPHLTGQQLDARLRLEDTWEDIREYVVDVLRWAGADAVEAEELAVVPGLDEVFALSDIKAYAEAGQWDLLVVDCAPTAETLRLLSLPDVLRWYMERVFPATRLVTRAVRPILSRATALPVAGEGVFAAVRRFHDRLDGVRELLTDREVTSARLVVNPERMVVAEARRTFTYLSLFGYHVDAVIANRLLPDAVSDPWFDEWKRVQKEQLEVIEEAFAPVPVLPAPLASSELVGPDRLVEFAGELYGSGACEALLHEGEPLAVRDEDGALVLSVHLPGVVKEDVELARNDDELLLAVGPYRRAIVLSDGLRRREVHGARMQGERLEIHFVEATR